MNTGPEVRVIIDLYCHSCLVSEFYTIINSSTLLDVHFNVVVKLYFLHIQATLIETIYVCVRRIYVDAHKDSSEEDELMKKVFMEILDVEIKSGLSNIFPSGKTHFWQIISKHVNHIGGSIIC